MRKILLIILLLFIIGQSQAQILSPRQLFPGLFEAVQMSDIYPDNKTFVDATPKYDPLVIMRKYTEQKDKPGFSLKQFVEENFTSPASTTTNFKTDVSAGIRKHID